MFKVTRAIKSIYGLKYRYLQTKNETEVSSRMASSQVRILEFVKYIDHRLFLTSVKLTTFFTVKKSFQRIRWESFYIWSLDHQTELFAIRSKVLVCLVPLRKKSIR